MSFSVASLRVGVRSLETYPSQNEYVRSKYVTKFDSASHVLTALSPQSVQLAPQILCLALYVMGDSTVVEYTGTPFASLQKSRFDDYDGWQRLRFRNMV